MRATPAIKILYVVLISCFSAGAVTVPNLSGIVMYTEASRYEPLAWMNGGERFPGTAHLRFIGLAAPVSLNRFSSTADGSPSYDGKKIIFSGKLNPAANWEIWELNLESREVRKVLACQTDCICPLYLPDRRFVFAQKIAGSFSIFVASLVKGTPVERLSFTHHDVIPNYVLSDGRIAFSATTSPLGEPDIFVMYTDGSGVRSYRCDHGTARYDARESRSGDLVFLTESGPAVFRSGSKRQQNLHVPGGGHIVGIAILTSGDFIFSRQAGLTSAYELLLWRAKSSKPHRLVSLGGVQPVVLQSREIPRRHPSALHDFAWANLLCLSVYESPHQLQHGSVRAVRVHAILQGRSEVIGSAEVEDDGSFFIKVPADVPIRMELLGVSQHPQAEERGWFWARRGEQRICVGCHAGPERAPENKVPKILQRVPAAPSDLLK